MKITKSVTEIGNLCIKKDWFTNGTNTQYERLFDRVRDGADIDEIATIIWICSENVTKEEIISQLVVPERKERVATVRAMELLANAVNDPNLVKTWLICGIADDIKGNTDEELECYTEDETFAELMNTFLAIMSEAKRNGGLYVDGVVSKFAVYAPIC